MLQNIYGSSLSKCCLAYSLETSLSLSSQPLSLFTTIISPSLCSSGRASRISWVGAVPTLFTKSWQLEFTSPLPVLDRTNKWKILFWKRTIQLGTRKNIRGILIQRPHFTSGMPRDVKLSAQHLKWLENLKAKKHKIHSLRMPPSHITVQLYWSKSCSWTEIILLNVLGHEYTLVMGLAWTVKKSTLPQILPRQGSPHSLKQNPSTSIQGGQKYFDYPPKAFKSFLCLTF